MADLCQDLLVEEGAEDGGPLGGTAGAETPTLAREGKQILSLAAVAVDAGEPCLQNTAVEEGVDGLVDDATPEAVASFEALLPQPLDSLVAGLDETIQRRGPGMAWPIDGGTVCSQGEAPSLLQRDIRRLTVLSGIR